MNVKMAVRKAKKLGIEVKTVVANDDCASAPKDELKTQRSGRGSSYVESRRSESGYGGRSG